MKLFEYQDIVTIYSVASSGYGNTKSVTGYEDIPAVFLQNTGFEHNGFRDGINSDARCYVDPENDFVIAENYRLEGMYILAPLFDATTDEGWYKVAQVNVNRDHLLGNTIDNVELILIKSVKLPNVS